MTQTDPAACAGAASQIPDTTVGPRSGGRDGAPRAALEAALLDVEEYAGVPDRWRGMLVAAAWHESKFAPHVLDGTKRGDGGRAVGMLQMHRTLRRHCGLDDETMLQPVAQAWCWLGRIVEVLPKARRQCPGWDPWKVAWAFVAQGPKDPETGEWYRCRAPRHVDVLRKMRR